MSHVKYVTTTALPAAPEVMSLVVSTGRVVLWDRQSRRIQQVRTASCNRAVDRMFRQYNESQSGSKVCPCILVDDTQQL